MGCELQAGAGMTRALAILSLLAAMLSPQSRYYLCVQGPAGRYYINTGGRDQVIDILPGMLGPVCLDLQEARGPLLGVQVFALTPVRVVHSSPPRRIVKREGNMVTFRLAPGRNVLVVKLGTARAYIPIVGGVREVRP
jgi:hypothetical protein